VNLQLNYIYIFSEMVFEFLILDFGFWILNFHFIFHIKFLIRAEGCCDSKSITTKLYIFLINFYIFFNNFNLFHICQHHEVLISFFLMRSNANTFHNSLVAFEIRALHYCNPNFIITRLYFIYQILNMFINY